MRSWKKLLLLAKLDLLRPLLEFASDPLAICLVTFSAHGKSLYFEKISGEEY